MATWIGLVFVGLLIGCIHAEQEQMQEVGLDSGGDLTTQVKSLQKNVTDLWTYIYQLRQAIEHHLTDLSRRQAHLEHQSMHSGTTGGHDSHGHDHHSDDHSSHSESSHHHEPLTASSDHHGDHSSSDHHHHDDHGSSDHRHDDHGSTDHRHDDHGSSDHRHDDHGSSDHRHDDHGSSDRHHDDHHDDHHHHDSHSTTGDHQHGDSHHSDTHDEHNHHHSTSESHTDDHSNHTDSDHSKEHGHDDHHHHHGDDHHDSHEKADKAHGDHQHSHEHKDSHEKEDKGTDDQQSVEDIEKPFTATVVRTPSIGQTPGSSDKTDELNRSDPLNLLGGHSHHHHHHHHNHQDHAQQTYPKVTIPKFSEYRQYTFATCDVQPNKILAPELQQDVKGQVLFWQKKSGGPLNIHVRLRGFAIGDHHGHQEQQQQANEAPVHKAGHRHGFHVHEFADLSAGCQSAGAHYNPLNANHGGPRSTERHVGDLGNIECDDHGVTNIVFPDNVASLTGQYSIVGKALVIHSDVDDLGMVKDDPESLKTGNAGARIACCVIQKVDKLPLATFKSIKTATNYQN